MTEKTVLLDIVDGVAAITLNRPERGNAVDIALARDLKDALRECENQRSLRAITLRGAGKNFCAGGDLAAIAAEGAGASRYVRELLTELHEALLAMARIPVSVVAAVHGAAAGAGLSLAAASDLAIATASARFITAYPKVGLTPDGSSSWYLPRVIGLKRALELSLLGGEIAAEKALTWGLINEVVPDDALDAKLKGMVLHLRTSATGALGAAKKLMRTSLEQPLDKQLTLEMQTICAALEGDEACEGLAAFAQRRTPHFR
jgi:2-(1,2-epoxy-1,2-dihydrophenyl)acetyl-CoA isomerase